MKLAVVRYGLGAVCAGVVAGLPFLGVPGFYLHIIILMMVFALLAMSLDILMGYVNLPSLGHAAFFGSAAYCVGVLTVTFGLAWGWALVAGLGLCLVIGAVFGLVAIRTTGLYFLLITLALGQLLWGAVNRWGSITGGYNGLPGVPKPFDFLEDTANFYYLALAVFVVLALAMARIVSSPFGLSLKAIAGSESRMAAIGYDVWLHKYLAFIITGVLAGCAGALNVFYIGFVSPQDLSIAMSAEAVLMVILGGAGTLWGPAIGAALIVLLRNFLSMFFEFWLIVLGALFIFAILFAPNGIAGWIIARRKTAGTVGTPVQTASEPGAQRAAARVAPLEGRAQRCLDPQAPVVLEIGALEKRFGGLTAVNGVSLAVRRGERVALLGPNGAGKTTLFNMIGGSFSPTRGTIRFDGRDITRLKPHQRSRIGIGRTFQVTNLFQSLSVAEHLRLCAVGVSGRRLSLHRSVYRDTQLDGFVEQALAAAGLLGLSDTEVRNLSYGHQRQLEVAMAVSMRPQLLLLDEPAAGLSNAEIGPILQTIGNFDKTITVIIVEHDMDVAFAVADRVIVFNHGEIVADGPPAQIKRNEEVRRIYLGRNVA